MLTSRSDIDGLPDIKEYVKLEYTDPGVENTILETVTRLEAVAQFTGFVNEACNVKPTGYELRALYANVISETPLDKDGDSRD